MKPNRHVLQVLMLAALHAGLYFELDGIGAKLLILASVGLFLLWQTLWNGGEKLNAASLLLLLLLSIFVTLFVNWWLAGIEIASLFALIGGRAWSFRDRWGRAFDLGSMLYLLALLFSWVIPHLFVPEMVNDVNRFLMKAVLPAILFLLAAIPSRGKIVLQDYFVSLFLFMLIVVLVLATFSFIALGKIGYLPSLAASALMLSLLFGALSWLWNPNSGFSGLKSLFAKYFLGSSIAMDEWLATLAEISETEQNENRLLRRACSLFSSLPSFSGIEWRADGETERIGVESPYRIEERWLDLNFCAWSEFRTNPAIEMQYRMRMQIVAHFFAAKKRERQLLRTKRQQAIFETGSRLTHDMKNLLQSLQVISLAAEEGGDIRPFLSSQLPELARRIEKTLQKFMMPGTQSEERVDGLEWWKNLGLRFSGRNILFLHGEIGSISLHGGLFDCVAENLIDNARKKRMAEPGIEITVHFSTEPLLLRVRDSGSAIPSAREKLLFSEIMPSASGYGIGLYQARQWAERSGFDLLLEHNETGNVSFLLRAASRPRSSARRADGGKSS